MDNDPKKSHGLGRDLKTSQKGEFFLIWLFIFIFMKMGKIIATKV